MAYLPDLPTFVAFTIACWILAITPGPDMTLTISRSLQDGKSGGLMVVFGTSLGIVVHTCLVAFGVSALIVASPTAFLALKTGGALYLVWLAFQAIRYGSSLSVKKEEGPGHSALGNFTTGFAVNVLNPKVILFFMTFLPQFVDAHSPNVTGQLMVLGLSFIVLGMPVNLMVVFLAERMASYLQGNPKILRAIDVTFAGVFSLFAVRILMAQAR